MKIFRSLLPVSGLVVLCGLMVFAADKVSSQPPHYGAPMAAPTSEPPLRQATSEAGEIVQAHPQLIELLLNRATLGDDSERTHAYAALTALTPAAAQQIVKAMEDADSNPETRIIAMSLLEKGEASPDCPRKNVCSALLRISQSDSEDAEIRKYATITLCRIICRMEGQPVPTSSAGSY